AGSDLAGLPDLELLVDEAVAVVVEAVATLRLVLDQLVRRRVGAGPAVLPHAHRLGARADALREAGDRRRADVVVDEAVAVVVEAVADLDAAVGLVARRLAAGDVRVAVVEARQARAHLAGAVHAARGRERVRAGDVAAAAVLDAVHEVEAFVDLAV